MKTSIVLPVLFVIVSLLMIHCASTEVAESKDVNQETIYQHYSVLYNAEKNNIEAEAVFRFGGNKGTTLMLSNPSRITVNGQDMVGDQKMLRGYVYEYFQFPEHTTDFSFIFSNTENKQFTNKISLYPIQEVVIPDSISLSQTTNISWTGPSVMQNEKIILKLKDKEGNESSITTNTKGSNEIIIKKEHLVLLKPGIGNLQIIRKIEKNLDESNKTGGIISGIYYSKIYQVQIGITSSI